MSDRPDTVRYGRASAADLEQLRRLYRDLGDIEEAAAEIVRRYWEAMKAAAEEPK